MHLRSMRMSMDQGVDTETGESGFHRRWSHVGNGFELGVVTFLHAALAVSYTHLDVYKRQGLDRMLGMALGLLRGAFLGCLLVLLMGFTPMTKEPSCCLLYTSRCV